MRFSALLLPLLAVMLMLAACSQPATETPAAEEAAAPEPEPEVEVDPTPGEVVASGVIVGRSGKPLANAKLVLGTVIGDEDTEYSKISLVEEIDTVTADAEGRFEIKGFEPGKYTILYQPSGSSLFPREVAIRSFQATRPSITPGLDAELGKRKPYDPREWSGGRFTLMTGHTMYSQGNRMKMWNATVRQGRGGPYMEVRKNIIWLQELEDNSEIKFEAWSY